MEKYYCTNCMLLLEQNKMCPRCGNQLIKKIEINVQAQSTKPSKKQSEL